MLANGVRLATERMPHVRSVAVGIWLTRGSRHEPKEHAGIAHFVEHMLFKGTPTRSAEAIAQQVDSIGGQIDAFTSKEYAGYYLKVLDEHLPLAIEVLADIVRRPKFAADDIEREKKVVLEEIKMVEDTPDDLVHELFSEQFWKDHPLGRPILGVPETVAALNQATLQRYFTETYHASNLIVSAAGHVTHEQVRELVERYFGDLPGASGVATETVPRVVPHVLIRNKELEQSHVCLGTDGYPQAHDERYTSYVLNTMLGGSMSSRLFQNVREKRGLAYSVFSGLSAYRDSGVFTVYAGCANEAVAELIDVVVEEIRRLKRDPPGEDELRRAKDHLKGSLMLSLENTGSRMNNLARQEIYFGRHFDMDEILGGIEAVEAADVRRIAREIFAGELSMSVLGNLGRYRPRPSLLKV